MNPVLPFHTNIDVTSELSGSLRQRSALVKSDEVEFLVMLPSTPSYPMSAIQDPVRPCSPADVDPVRGRLVFWLLAIGGVLAFDLFSVSRRSKVFGEVGA